MIGFTETAWGPSPTPTVSPTPPVDEPTNTQIEIINARFTPTETERRWAERVIAAFEASGSNVVQLDGVMLDAPHLTQARRIMKALQP